MLVDDGFCACNQTRTKSFRHIFLHCLANDQTISKRILIFLDFRLFVNFCQNLAIFVIKNVCNNLMFSSASHFISYIKSESLFYHQNLQLRVLFHKKNKKIMID